VLHRFEPKHMMPHNNKFLTPWLNDIETSGWVRGAFLQYVLVMLSVIGLSAIERLTMKTEKQSRNIKYFTPSSGGIPNTRRLICQQTSHPPKRSLIFLCERGSTPRVNCHRFTHYIVHCVGNVIMPTRYE
jgi:hypothetical protein